MRIDSVDRTGRGAGKFVKGNLGAVPAKDLVGAGAMAAAAKVLSNIAAVLSVPASELQEKTATTDGLGLTHLRYERVVKGIPVVGGEVLVHFDRAGVAYAAQTDGPTFANAPSTASLTLPRALQIAETADATIQVASTSGTDLVYVADAAGAAHLAYDLTVAGTRQDEPVRDRVFIDASSGVVVARHALVHAARSRQVYDANHTMTLPGTLWQWEGGGGSLFDSVVAENFALLGDAYRCLWEMHGRDSFDGSGGTLKSAIHWGSGYTNAHSMGGGQFVFGDGNGITRGQLATDRDVVTHEVMHAVTERFINYGFEGAAISESLSDVFAASCSAHLNGVNANTWRIGEKVTTPGVPNDAARRMDDPAAEGDPDFFPERLNVEANAHENAGIANLAFYLVSQGGPHPRGKTPIVVPALGIVAARHIWYHALTTYMSPSTDFYLARIATVQAATDLAAWYGTQAKDSVNAAWEAVGVSWFGSPYKAHDWFCVGSEICELGDVNGDGKDDLIAFERGTSGNVWVALSNGTGFAPGVLAKTNFCVGNQVCRVADVDGDGAADIVAFVRGTPGAAGSGQVWVSRSNASSSSPAFIGGYVAHPYFCVGDEICQLGDLNGDGRADLVAFVRGPWNAPWAGKVWTTVAPLKMPWTPPQDVYYGMASITQNYFCIENEDCRVADVNGDGHADLVAFVRGVWGAPANGDVYVALENGNGVSNSFGGGYLAHGQMCADDAQCAVGDVTGDGKADILAFHRAVGDVWAADSYGSMFGGGYLAHTVMCNGTQECRVGDIDGDGRADLVAFARTQGSVALGDGDVWVSKARLRSYGEN